MQSSSCRARTILQNEPFVANIGVDTAENEPSEILKFGCRPTTEALYSAWAASRRSVLSESSAVSKDLQSALRRQMTLFDLIRAVFDAKDLPSTLRLKSSQTDSLRFEATGGCRWHESIEHASTRTLC